MMIQIDQLRSLADAANRSLLNRLAFPHQRDHATIVISIHLAIEQVHAIHLHRRHDRIDLGLIATLRKIRNALH